MHELFYYAGGGLFACVVLVNLVDRLPLPEFKIDGDRQSSEHDADSARSAQSKQTDGSPLKSFPSACFSSTDSMYIVEEIVDVDTSDLNLPSGEDRKDPEGDETSKTMHGKVHYSKKSNPELQRKENASAIGSSKLLVEKALGLSDAMREQMRHEVKERMAKSKDGDLLSATDSVEPLNAVKVLEWLIFLCIMGLGCYALNEYTKGDFGRVVAGFFPRETAALGLQRYLETKHLTQPGQARAEVTTQKEL